jgi:hypothetical protein
MKRIKMELTYKYFIEVMKANNTNLKKRISCDIRDWKESTGFVNNETCNVVIVVHLHANGKTTWKVFFHADNCYFQVSSSIRRDFTEDMGNFLRSISKDLVTRYAIV